MTSIPEISGGGMESDQIKFSDEMIHACYSFNWRFRSSGHSFPSQYAYSYLAGSVLIDGPIKVSWSVEEAALRRKVRLDSGYAIPLNHRKTYPFYAPNVFTVAAIGGILDFCRSPTSVQG